MLGAFCRLTTQHAGVAEAVRAVQARQPARLGGLSGSFRALVLAHLQVESGRPLAVALPHEIESEALLLDLRTFHAALGDGRQVVSFPPLGVDPYGTLTPHPDVVRERLQTLDRCVAGHVGAVLGPALSWLEKLQTPATFQRSSLRIEPGEEVSVEELSEKLLATGYKRHSLVESLGEFAVRGGIIDVFPPTRENPVRMELFGDMVESLREFNSRDQRSMRAIDVLELPPARERAGTNGHEEGTSEGTAPAATLAAFLSDPLWIEIEPETLEREFSEWWEQLDEHYHRALAEGVDAPLPEDLYVTGDGAPWGRGGDHLTLHELAEGPSQPGAINLLAQPAPPFRGRLAELAEHVERSLAEGDRICFAMSRPGKAERLAEILDDYGVSSALHLPGEGGTGETVAPEDIEAGSCWVTCADISAGFRLPDLGLWLATDTEVFGRSRPRARPRRFHGDAFKADFRNLTPGDFVVHMEHGIGQFVDVRQLAVNGDEREFMEVAYRDEARLYLPLDQLHLVQRYRGVEGAAPKLDRLGGSSWAKVTGKVKRELRELATELLELYAARKAIRGRAFGPDTPWQREMEDTFEYEETRDQSTAIVEVKADMEAPKPMDRLLCGDVGYGKTEVAMRAAFKAVMDGRQVAVLAPTTVLAHQHLQTFTERMAAFPIRIDLLSRFRSPRQQAEVVAGVDDGTIDILIGTHRILSKDVQFSDFGLMIVDEEQRFGVTHKERLKHLKREVDVLSMTATPIPRTLQMSLVGVRDLSIIESPPKDRFAVATHVVPYDPEIIATAIREELARDGQVFFVHNRVETIYSIAAKLRELVPEARYRVGHGQLPERELERAMLDFVSHEADVLVTTTIIENGLDIPLANTMIINRADRFGLAQLYQLRGRIGRSDRRASAYLMIPPVHTLSPAAKKRLRAIQEFADLGSGFRLAAMDLEIRGAGSLLGERQHGQMAAVGFETYARLLEESVRELQGEPAAAEQRAQLNLGLNLSIPPDYVDDAVQRLMVAKRLASARDGEHLEALRNELRDRYGPMPSEVEDLISYVEIRLLAESLGILSVDRGTRRLDMRFSIPTKIDLGGLVARVARETGWLMKPPDRLVVPLPDPEEGGGTASTLVTVHDLLESLA
jgi:transcription-repair coupling factor (superfamily II helicase)